MRQQHREERREIAFRVAAGQGGLDALTVRMPAGTCLRDLRLTFRDGREQTMRNIDVCRTHGLRLDTRR